MNNYLHSYADLLVSAIKAHARKDHVMSSKLDAVWGSLPVHVVNAEDLSSSFVEIGGDLRATVLNQNAV